MLARSAQGRQNRTLSMRKKPCIEFIAPPPGKAILVELEVGGLARSEWRDCNSRKASASKCNFMKPLACIRPGSRMRGVGNERPLPKEAEPSQW